MTTTSKKLCIYHKNCLDGFTSAYVLGMFLDIAKVEFLGMDYHDPIPDFTDRDVYILDFSFTPEVLVPEIIKAKSVVMLDHHKKAMDDWGLNWEEDKPRPGSEHKNFLAIVETSKSGVGVVWDFLYNNNCHTETKLPLLFQHVQDYDMYQFKLKHTRAIHTALTSTNMMADQNFMAFNQIFNDFEDGDTEALIERGYTVLAAQQVWVKDIIERTRGEIDILGYRVPIANVPHELRDLAGEMLYENVPFSITYEDRIKDGVRKFSLRSDRNGGVNVINIAKELGGGGGHPNASGFTLPLAGEKRNSPNAATLAELINF